jgi:hypothetical protein
MSGNSDAFSNISGLLPRIILEFYVLR